MDGWIQNTLLLTTFKYHSFNPKPIGLYPSQMNKRRKKNNMLKNDRFFHLDFDKILTISHNILIISDLTLKGKKNWSHIVSFYSNKWTSLLLLFNF